MPGGFFIYKAAQPEELIYANKPVFDIFGCSDQDKFKALTGFTFRGMVHPDDYGHYCETKAYGGIYVVFISDITEKREQRETDKATRDAAISWLTNAYNTVWLISDVVTEESTLYHTDLDEVHTQAIRNALSHARYTDTKTEYVNTMVAKEDRARMQEQIRLKNDKSDRDFQK